MLQADLIHPAVQTNAKLIALDADGVLVNYNDAYAHAWERAFGHRPAEKDPRGYTPLDRWDVPRLDVAGRNLLRACMQDSFWSSMDAMPGAVRACRELKNAGYTLVCVSALRTEFRSARARNLKALGFPLDAVHATPATDLADDGTRAQSPKAQALNALMPAAFVDDYAPYLRGVASTIHKGLLLRDPNGSPNVGENLRLADSTHADLTEFAQWWLAERT
jgi:phosphoglycolate phosphatase-like HAD superfamily hydrolase